MCLHLPASSSLQSSSRRVVVSAKKAASDLKRVDKQHFCPLSLTMHASSARQSTVSTGMQGHSSGQSRLQAKRQELEGLQILKEQSARLARDIETLSQGVDQLVEGGEGGSGQKMQTDTLRVTHRTIWQLWQP